MKNAFLKNPQDIHRILKIFANFPFAFFEWDLKLLKKTSYSNNIAHLTKVIWGRILG